MLLVGGGGAGGRYHAGGGGAGGGPTGNRSAGTGGDGLVVIAYPQGVTYTF